MPQNPCCSLSREEISFENFKYTLLIKSYNESQEKFYFIFAQKLGTLLRLDSCPVIKHEASFSIIPIKIFEFKCSYSIFTADSNKKIEKILHKNKIDIESVMMHGTFGFMKKFNSRLSSVNEDLLIELCRENPANLDDIICNKAIFSIAIEQKKYRLINFLIQNNLLINMYDSRHKEGPLSLTVKLDDFKTFCSLIEYDSYNILDVGNAIEAAAQKNSIEYIEFIISKDISLINVIDNVFLAAKSFMKLHNIEFFKLLYTLCPQIVNMTDPNGQTLLHTAVSNSYSDFIDIILPNVKYIDSVDNEGLTAFSHAAMNDDSYIMTKLITFNCDPDKPDFNGIRPVEYIVYHNNLNIFSILINKIDIKIAINRGILHIAAEYGYHSLIRTLYENNNEIIDFKNHVGDTALIVAVTNAKTDVVKTLLNFNADLNILSHEYWSPLQIASLKGCNNIVKLLLESNKIDINHLVKSGNSPIYIAAKTGNLDLCKMLIHNYASIDNITNDSVTPLLIAIRNDHTQVALYLIEEGASCSVSDKYLNGPIISASSRGNLSILNSIFRHNPSLDVHISNIFGETAMFWAASNGHGHILETLLTYGFDLDKGDNYNSSPLSVSIANNHSSTTKILLEMGADFSKKTRSGSPKISELLSLSLPRDLFSDQLMQNCKFSESEKSEIKRVPLNVGALLNTPINTQDINNNTQPSTPSGSPICYNRKFLSL